MRRILILGNQGVGKTDLAYTLARGFGLPVYDGVTKVEDIQEMEGIYVSNSIAIEEAPTLKNIHVINIAKY